MNGLFVISSAFLTLIGVLIGGGIRALETKSARQIEDKALFSALAAEVEALLRLMQHRGFVEHLKGLHAAAVEHITDGRGVEAAQFTMVSLSHNYLAVYDALVSKIGLLPASHANMIVQFYTYIMAVHENYDARSHFHAFISANKVAEITENDLSLMVLVMAVGEDIRKLRQDEAR